MVLPEGFVLPPWYVTTVLVVVLAGVVALLWALDPPVTDRTVVAFAPWMMLGSTLHVLHRLEVYPTEIEILFSSPTVYVTTAILAGSVWILGSLVYAAGLQSSTERVVGSIGTGFFVMFTMIILFLGWEMATFDPFWPVISIVVAGLVSALAWIVLSLWFTEVAAITSLTGALVVFSQTLDGVSTAVGYDVLGAHEEVPLSRLILENAESIPTYEYIGAGWAFVLVKVLLALIVLGIFKEYVRESPRQARLLLGAIAAVGLGPGVHNVLSFVLY